MPYSSSLKQCRSWPCRPQSSLQTVVSFANYGPERSATELTSFEPPDFGGDDSDHEPRRGRASDIEVLDADARPLAENASNHDADGRAVRDEQANQLFEPKFAVRRERR